MGEVGRPGRQPDLAQHLPGISCAPARPATSAPNLTFSSAVSPGNRLKLWNTKLTV
jgi:hypothetical protein